MSQEIQFESKHLVSYYPADFTYHDDYNGEGVWFNLPRIPFFLNSTDFREFNGFKLKDIAKFLDDYFEEFWGNEINWLKKWSDFRQEKKP